MGGFFELFCQKVLAENLKFINHLVNDPCADFTRKIKQPLPETMMLILSMAGNCIITDYSILSPYSI